MRGREAGGDMDGRYGNNGLARSTDLGLGMVAKEVKDDVLPLRSGYFDWAMDYFRTPQMKVSDVSNESQDTEIFLNRRQTRMSRVVRLIMNKRGSIREMSRWSKGVGRAKSSPVSCDNIVQRAIKG